MNPYCIPIADELQRLKDVEGAMFSDQAIQDVRDGHWHIAISLCTVADFNKSGDTTILAALVISARNEETGANDKHWSGPPRTYRCYEWRERGTPSTPYDIKSALYRKKE